MVDLISNQSTRLSQLAMNEDKEGPFYNKSDTPTTDFIYENPGIGKLTEGPSDQAWGVQGATTGNALKPIVTEIGKEGAKEVGTSTLGSILPVAGAALGTYKFYDQWNGLKGAAGKLNYNEGMGALRGAAQGASIGTAILPGVGTAIGAGLGAIVGGSMKKLKTGKGEDQLKRDLVREALVKKGFLDEKGRYTLANGTVFEMGKDGGFKYADGFHAYEVDHNDKLQGTVFGHALPIAEMLTGSDDKLTSDFAGYLTRMALSDTKDLNQALSNIKDAAVKLGIDSPDKVAKYVGEMTQKGAIKPEEAAAYINGAGNLFSDSRVLSLIGDPPTAQPQKSAPTASTAQKATLQKTPERARHVQKAVSSVVATPVPSQEEINAQVARDWANKYEQARNERFGGGEKPWNM